MFGSNAGALSPGPALAGFRRRRGGVRTVAKARNASSREICRSTSCRVWRPSSSSSRTRSEVVVPRAFACAVTHNLHGYDNPRRAALPPSRASPRRQPEPASYAHLAA